MCPVAHKACLLPLLFFMQNWGTWSKETAWPTELTVQVERPTSNGDDGITKWDKIKENKQANNNKKKKTYFLVFSRPQKYIKQTYGQTDLFDLLFRTQAYFLPCETIQKCPWSLFARAHTEVIPWKNKKKRHLIAISCSVGPRYQVLFPVYPRASHSQWINERKLKPW